MRTLAYLLAALHSLNLAAAIAFWWYAPGPRFARWAMFLSIAFAFAWALAALAHKRLLTLPAAFGVVAVGTLLPWVWILGVGIGLVTVVIVISASLFGGIAFVALCPLLAWGAFVGVHFGSRWVLQRLGAS